MSVTIVNRYLVREMAMAWIAVAVVLVAVLFTNRFIRYLGDAASGSLPGDSILLLMGYKALSYTPLVIPGSLFLGIILALGRFYRDSEMAALSACGVGPGRIYRSVMLLALPLALVVAWLSLSIAPWAAHEGRVAEGAARENVEIAIVRPGQFMTSSRVDGVFYIEAIDSATNQMHDVFIQSRRGDEQIILASRSGVLRVDPQSGDRYLVLLDGRRYDGLPGEGAWRQMRYASHGVRIAEGEPSAPRTRRDGMRTEELMAARDDPGAIAELQWRMSMPLMVLVLAVIAVPLGKSSPREGRYARLLAAVLVFAVYANLLAVSQGWIEDGAIPPGLGVWWVHVLALLAALIVLARQYRWGVSVSGASRSATASRSRR